MAATVDYTTTANAADYHPIDHERRAYCTFIPGVQVGPVSVPPPYTSDIGHGSFSLGSGLCPGPPVPYPHQQPLSRPPSSIPNHHSPLQHDYHSYSASVNPNAASDVDQSACGPGPAALTYRNPPGESGLHQVPSEHFSTIAIDQQRQQQHHPHYHYRRDHDFDNRNAAYLQPTDPYYSADEDHLKGQCGNTTLHLQSPWDAGPCHSYGVDGIVAPVSGPDWDTGEIPPGPNINRNDASEIDQHHRKKQPSDNQGTVDPDQEEQEISSPTDIREKNRLAARKCRGKNKRHEQTLKDREKTLISQGMALRVEYDEVHGEALYLRNEILRHVNCNCEPIQEYIRTSASATTRQQQQQQRDQDGMPG